MWIVLNDAFLSIVAEPGQPDRLLVRARFPGDLKKVFPDAAVEETRGRDYRYRTVLPRLRVATVIGAAVARIDYPNFKDSVKEEWRHDLYLDAWARFNAEQYRHLPRRGRAAFRRGHDWVDGYLGEPPLGPDWLPPRTARPARREAPDPGWEPISSGLTGDQGEPFDVSDPFDAYPEADLPADPLPDFIAKKPPRGKGRRTKLTRKGG